MNRAALLIAALAFLLSGCGDSPSAAAKPEPFPVDVPQQLQVRSPKDARGVPPCDLLTSAQLVAIGLDPTTARPAVRGLGESCLWYYADRSTYASVGISTNPDATKLPGMYRQFRDFPGFALLEVAGHPALRADELPDRKCTLAVGIADLQNLTVDAYFDLKPRPDPCAPAKRMAELVLSNLPPLAEEPR